jgi:hypothetical protein
LARLSDHRNHINGLNSLNSIPPGQLQTSFSIKAVVI